MQVLACSRRNEGAASDGLSLTIAGPALDDELVIITSATLSIGVPTSAGTFVMLERRKDAKGRTSLVATLPTASYPEGTSAKALSELMRTPPSKQRLSLEAPFT